MKKISPLILWFGIIFLIMLIGVIGFMLIEHYNFLDAVYMTVITITTIGYSEIHNMSDTGRMFNIFLIISSFSTFTYALARLTQYIASGEMSFYFKNQKMVKAIQQLNNHVIICGFGRNGQQAAKTLKAHGVPFIVIDQVDALIDSYLKEDPNLLFIKGDATIDSILYEAGIERAQSLICTLPTDADNVFIVLSARALHQSLKIISRASAATSVAKLKKAGADNVIMPDKIGGIQMATLVSRPDVIEFIDYLSSEEGNRVSIESVAYERLPNNIKDTSLKNIMEWESTGVTCIGVKDKHGKFFINPSYDTIISEGMKIIVLGNHNQIEAMKTNVADIQTTAQ
ncbi:MAG: potassium channel family protein [Chitinophagaceae bacterium]